MTDGAIEREFVVASELGFHARPAGEFVRAASRFAAEVEVSRGDEWVSAQSVLSLLSLAASQGTRLRLRAIGSDAEQAIATLGAMIEREQAAG
ncbi:MAG: HPr family phosphocarrier protein [Myxococcota bacterium]